MKKSGLSERLNQEERKKQEVEIIFYTHLHLHIPCLMIVQGMFGLHWLVQTSEKKKHSKNRAEKNIHHTFFNLYLTMLNTIRDQYLF